LSERLLKYFASSLFRREIPEIESDFEVAAMCGDVVDQLGRVFFPVRKSVVSKR